MDDLKIKPPKTNKSKIPRNQYMTEGVVPYHPCSILFNGRSGSGKTVLLYNLLNKFYKNYFDEMYLFSGSPDDIFDEFKIPDDRTFSEAKQWDTELKKIYDKQKTLCKKGIHKAPRVLIIFEDIINHQRFQNQSSYFKKSFMANRHYSISTWITSQSYTKLLKACRINVNTVYYFPGTLSEKQLIVEEYSPNGLSKREVSDMFNYATKDNYAFLTIMTRKKESIRYRKNLDTILRLD